jgi:hypothetical protein
MGDGAPFAARTTIQQTAQISRWMAPVFYRAELTSILPNDAIPFGWRTKAINHLIDQASSSHSLTLNLRQGRHARRIAIPGRQKR